MSMYLFILGKDRELSLAELFSVYPNPSIEAIGREFVMMKLPAFIQSDLNRFGGVIKAARFLTSARPNELNQTLFEVLSERYTDRKITYGLSVYEGQRLNLRQILSRLKKSLKAEDIKSRFVNQDYKNLSSAHSKGLFKEGHAKGGRGIELVIAQDKGHFLIGEVVAAQDIDAYSKRDYEKPYRNMKVGMLPPKLAQILINLTGVKTGGRVWDPFCGTGTVLMEGLLMGHRMFGSDISADLIQGARQNVEWLKQEFGIEAQAEYLVHDATKPLKDHSFDAIACEGYLGPPQERQWHADQLQPLVTQLEKLYFDFFKALHEVKFRGSIVIALPFFRAHEGREVMLEGVVKKIKQFGFQPTPLFPQTFFLKYARPDQLVGRAIYRFIAGS
ncbi:MAG: methyltransferase domain-containing protein [Candidatus Peregrinibacteria bacterium]